MVFFSSTHPKRPHTPPPFVLNDNPDLLGEVLSRLDGRSLCAAASVCRLWSATCRRDSVWERVCTGGGWTAPPGQRAVVAALGGFRRLYKVCVGPAVERRRRGGGVEVVQLWVSLLSVEVYEREMVGSGLGRPASLFFLCKAN